MRDIFSARSVLWFTSLRISAALRSDVTAKKFDGMRYWKVVASSDGRNDDSFNQAASAHWRTPTVIVKGVEGAFCFALELIFAPVVLTLLVNKCVV